MAAKKKGSGPEFEAAIDELLVDPELRRNCSICKHERIEEINAVLRTYSERIHAGTTRVPLSSLCERLRSRYGKPPAWYPNTLHDHAEQCLGVTLRVER